MKSLASITFCILLGITLTVSAGGCNSTPLDRDCDNRTVAVEWSSDGELFAVAWRNEVGIFHSSDYEALETIGGFEGILSINWHPDNSKMAITMMDQPPIAFISVVDLATSERLTSEGEFFTSPVAWSMDGSYIAVGNYQGEILIWNNDLTEPIQILEEDDQDYEYGANSTMAICWSSNEQQITGLFLGSTFVFDLLNEEIIASSSVGGESGDCDADGSVLITKEGSYVNLIDGTAEQFWTADGFLAGFTVSWSPDNERVAINTEEGFIQIHTASTGELIYTLEGGMSENQGMFNDYNDSLAWSPDGTMLAEAGQDGLVRIWDTETYELIQTLSFEEEE